MIGENAISTETISTTTTNRQTEYDSDNNDISPELWSAVEESTRRITAILDASYAPENKDNDEPPKKCRIIKWHLSVEIPN